MGNILIETMKKVLVFDFDGVLAISWTQPELHFPQIPALVKKLSEKYILCVASYNPRAIKAIESWDLHHYFKCMRAGANHVWEDEYKEEFRKDLSKAKQIESMMEELREMGYDINELTFFDDDPKNLAVVNENLPHVRTVLINENKGVTTEDINNYLAHS